MTLGGLFVLAAARKFPADLIFFAVVVIISIIASVVQAAKKERERRKRRASLSEPGGEEAAAAAPPRSREVAVSEERLSRVDSTREAREAGTREARETRERGSPTPGREPSSLERMLRGLEAQVEKKAPEPPPADTPGGLVSYTGAAQEEAPPGPSPYTAEPGLFEPVMITIREAAVAEMRPPRAGRRERRERERAEEAAAPEKALEAAPPDAVRGVPETRPPVRLSARAGRLSPEDVRGGMLWSFVLGAPRAADPYEPPR